MAIVYPIIARRMEDYYFVRIPAFDTCTEGKDLADAIEMARDAICLMGLEFEDAGKPLPDATPINAEEGDIVTWVDADLIAYRRKYDKKTVKKNCTIPSYLNYEAEKQGINFSKVLQDALIEKLGITL